MKWNFYRWTSIYIGLWGLLMLVTKNILGFDGLLNVFYNGFLILIIILAIRLSWVLGDVE